MAIYLVTGIWTGFQVFYLMMEAIWGAATSPLEYVSLAGSAVLFLAAFVTLFKPRFAAGIAVVGAVAVWSFYAPALIFSLSRVATGLLFNPLASILTLLAAVGPILLLTACTVYAVKRFRRCGSVGPASTS